MTSAPALPRLLPRAVFSLGVLLCLWTYLPPACDGPWPFDYDDATQGIFTNDLTRGARHDASFRDSQAPQDLYRANWSVQRLPYSLLLSGAQRLLGVPPHDVERLIGDLALLFAGLGSLFAALALARGPGASVAERWAIAAFVAVHPAFLPFVRTGASFYLLAFALFWGAVYCTVLYAELRSGGSLALLAVLVALFALNPYPPLAALPFVLLLVLGIHGQVRTALRDLRVYGAAVISVALFAGASTTLALTYEGSLPSYFRRIAAFQAARSHSVSLDQLTARSPGEKLVGYVDRHLLFAVDGLGDPSREDWIWALGRPSLALLATLPVMLVGAVAGLRRRERATGTCLAVLGATGALFATVSFPESRYLLALVPCYAFLAVRGARALLPDPRARELAVGVALALLALDTGASLRSHERAVRERWHAYDGIREAAPALFAFGDEPLRVSLPGPKRLEPSLYFRMAMPPSARWLGSARFERLLGGEGSDARLVVVEYADREAQLARLRGLGFSEVGRVRARASGRPMRILTRPPSLAPHEGAQAGSVLDPDVVGPQPREARVALEEREEVEVEAVQGPLPMQGHDDQLRPAPLEVLDHGRDDLALDGVEPLASLGGRGFGPGADHRRERPQIAVARGPFDARFVDHREGGDDREGDHPDRTASCVPVDQPAELAQRPVASRPLLQTLPQRCADSERSGHQQQRDGEEGREARGGRGGGAERAHRPAPSRERSYGGERDRGEREHPEGKAVIVPARPGDEIGRVGRRRAEREDPSLDREGSAPRQDERGADRSGEQQQIGPAHEARQRILIGAVGFEHDRQREAQVVALEQHEIRPNDEPEHGERRTGSNPEPSPCGAGAYQGEAGDEAILWLEPQGEPGEEAGCDALRMGRPMAARTGARVREVGD